MSTWPSGSGLTEVRGGGTHLHPQNPKTTLDDNLFSMNGPIVYKMARKKVYDMIAYDLSNNNLESPFDGSITTAAAASPKSAALSG